MVNLCRCLKCFEYKQLYENKLENSFNEVDTCGIFLKHSSSVYMNLVFLTNLADSNSIVCVSFPKKSEVTSNERLLFCLSKFSQDYHCCIIESFLATRTSSKTRTSLLA